MERAVGERRMQEDLDEHRDEMAADRHSRRSCSRTSPIGKSGAVPSRKSRWASWRWASVSCISSITRAASRILVAGDASVRLRQMAQSPRNVAVKNAVWVRSRGSRNSEESRYSSESEESSRSGSIQPRPRFDCDARSMLCPSATPTSAPSGPPSAKPSARRESFRTSSSPVPARA